MNWRVGVLRAGAENTAWATAGTTGDWGAARRCAIDALHELAAREGRRQEYRMVVDDVTVIAWPGLSDDNSGGLGGLDLSGVDDVLPLERDSDAAVW